MASRFRLYDNGGNSVDRYTLIDCKPFSCSGYSNFRNYAGFSSNPYAPHGFGITGEMDAKGYYGHVFQDFRNLGKRCKTAAAVPEPARYYMLTFMRDFGASKKQLRAMFGSTLPTPPKGMFG